jgi:hypothetical protein
MKFQSVSLKLDKKRLWLSTLSSLKASKLLMSTLLKATLSPKTTDLIFSTVMPTQDHKWTHFQTNFSSHFTSSLRRIFKFKMNFWRPLEITVLIVSNLFILAGLRTSSPCSDLYPLLSFTLN